MKLLIIEDDQELLRTILKYFDSFGYVCEKAKTISEAKSKLAEYSYDCVVLDLNLPDGNGLEIFQSLKKNSNKIGVLILSANDSLDDKLSGLELGADDYLTKPFHLAELNARVKSIVRRNQFKGKDEIEFKEIKIDTNSNEVFVYGERIKLTKKEYELLLFLISNQNRIVTKQSLSDHIWGDFIEKFDSYDYIYSHLKNLRKKIIEKGGNDYVKTVYGIGYKFTEHD
jgi:DNA-binding response OmpR family regulator